MRGLWVALLAVHGLIHLMGFMKAFQLAELPQLAQPIPRSLGLLWLLAGVCFAGASFFFLFHRPFWWMWAAPALALSQFLIFLSWGDAKFGTAANLLILLPVVISAAGALPSGFNRQFQDQALRRLAGGKPQSLLTEADLRPLPGPVKKYLRFAGAVGKPKVWNFHAVFTGKIRGKRESAWMPFTAGQYNFFDEPTRDFLMKASLWGIPFDAFHLFAGGAASMRVKIASLFQIVDARGEKMNQSETVTFFNDICFLAPSRLIDPAIRWESDGPLSVKAFYTDHGTTIAALLRFDETGALVDFISKDRFQSADGKVYLNYPWSTPLSGYKDFGGRKVASHGEAAWHDPEGMFTYGLFDLNEIQYNCGP